METTAKVHTRSRHRQRQSEQAQPLATADTDAVPSEETDCASATQSNVLTPKDECSRSSDNEVEEPVGRKKITHKSPPLTVLLVNGQVPSSPLNNDTLGQTASAQASVESMDSAALSESPLQQPGKTSSSRNSSGDALSLRETLQQLPATTSYRHRRNQSPQKTEILDSSFHRGILGYMDRELKLCSPTPSGNSRIKKLQSLSDPQASPAQRSTRSRNSLEKSPRRKRSKSESRRRRERKLIAAGEMEVRQANETLMRYLKQCTEINDASLSGELEIDHNFDERRVHRKTKSQRDKRGHLINKLYTSGGLSSILKELSDDIVPADGEEIYNPFTPVVSPTDDMPTHIDKIFLQTSSGYRPVERSYYKHSFVGSGSYVGGSHNARLDADGSRIPANGNGGNGRICIGSSASARGSCTDAHNLLQRSAITTNIQLACVIHRIWHLFSNMCHGLLAGLALAHLIFVLSSHSLNWQTDEKSAYKLDDKSNFINTIDSKETIMDATNFSVIKPETSGSLSSLAEIYLNTYYTLAILCLLSVIDRMDICQWHFPGASELISFRWLIIAMIYIITIILTVSSTLVDEQLYGNWNVNKTLTNNEVFYNSLRSLWSSLSVTRSICAICGWLLISATPDKDLLYDHLLDLFRYQLLNN